MVPLLSCTIASGARVRLPMMSSKDDRVPEPASRETTVMPWSGPPSSLQVRTAPLKTPRTWSRVSAETGFEGCTTTAIPSRATTVAVNAFASAGRSTRSAIPTSAVPETADWMPTAEPPPWTLMYTSGRPATYASASFSANGWNAVDPARVNAFFGRPHPERPRAATDSMTR